MNLNAAPGVRGEGGAKPARLLAVFPLSLVAAPPPAPDGPPGFEDAAVQGLSMRIEVKNVAETPAEEGGPPVRRVAEHYWMEQFLDIAGGRAAEWGVYSASQPASFESPNFVRVFKDGLFTHADHVKQGAVITKATLREAANFFPSLAGRVRQGVSLTAMARENADRVAQARGLELELRSPRVPVPVRIVNPLGNPSLETVIEWKTDPASGFQYAARVKTTRTGPGASLVNEHWVREIRADPPMEDALFEAPYPDGYEVRGMRNPLVPPRF